MKKIIVLVSLLIIIFTFLGAAISFTFEKSACCCYTDYYYSNGSMISVSPYTTTMTNLLNE